MASRQLSILSIAYPLAPVRIDPVGGAEQILARIDLAPEACRRAARERFSARRMTGEYLTLYRRPAGAGLNRSIPLPDASRAPRL